MRVMKTATDPGNKGYVYSPSCKMCNAKDRDGKPLRYEIENFAISATAAEIIARLAGHGVFVTGRQISAHLERHAPYILEARKNGSKKIQKMVVKITQTKVEVGEAIQRIIDIGDGMVKDGTMPVTERLYVEALKEQGRRGTRTTLDAEFETLDADFINKIKELNRG